MNVLVDVIYPSIEEMNESLGDEEKKIPQAEDAPIFGAGAALDSIGLVNFIVIVEELIGDKTGQSVVLANEKAMSLKHSPFRNVGSLATYIEALLEEDTRG